MGSNESASEIRQQTFSANLLHSPNTTSTTTYTFMIGVEPGGTAAVNRTTANTDAFRESPGISTITLLEIDGT